MLALTGIEHVVAGGEGIPMHMLTFPVADVHPMVLALVRRKELVISETSAAHPTLLLAFKLKSAQVAVLLSSHTLKFERRPFLTREAYDANLFLSTS